MTNNNAITHDQLASWSERANAAHEKTQELKKWMSSTTKITETYDRTTITLINRRVHKLNNGYGEYYYVQKFKHDVASSLVLNNGRWVTCSRGYAHATSAYAALGRMVQKDSEA